MRTFHIVNQFFNWALRFLRVVNVSYEADKQYEKLSELATFARNINHAIVFDMGNTFDQIGLRHA